MRKLNELFIVQVACFVCPFAAGFELKTSNVITSSDSVLESKYVLSILDVNDLSTSEFVDDAISKNLETIVTKSRNGQSFVCYLPESKLGDGQVMQNSSVKVTNHEIQQRLKSLVGTVCPQVNQGWWTYEFCFGSQITQFHVDTRDLSGANNVFVSLGHYDSETFWDNQTFFAEDLKNSKSSLHHSQQYSNGSKCELTGEARESEVRYYCASQFKITITEPSTCNYLFVVNTPVLCDLSVFKKKTEGEEHFEQISCVPNVPLAVPRQREQSKHQQKDDRPIKNNLLFQEKSVPLDVENFVSRLRPDNPHPRHEFRGHPDDISDKAARADRLVRSIWKTAGLEVTSESEEEAIPKIELTHMKKEEEMMLGLKMVMLANYRLERSLNEVMQPILGMLEQGTVPKLVLDSLMSMVYLTEKIKERYWDGNYEKSLEDALPDGSANLIDAVIVGEMAILVGSEYYDNLESISLAFEQLTNILSAYHMTTDEEIDSMDFDQLSDLYSKMDQQVQLHAPVRKVIDGFLDFLDKLTTYGSPDINEKLPDPKDVSKAGSLTNQILQSLRDVFKNYRQYLLANDAMVVFRDFNKKYSGDHLLQWISKVEAAKLKSPFIEKWGKDGKIPLGGLKLSQDLLDGLVEEDAAVATGGDSGSNIAPKKEELINSKFKEDAQPEKKSKTFVREKGASESYSRQPSELERYKSAMLNRRSVKLGDSAKLGKGTAVRVKVVKVTTVGGNDVDSGDVERAEFVIHLDEDDLALDGVDGDSSEIEVHLYAVGASEQISDLLSTPEKYADIIKSVMRSGELYMSSGDPTNSLHAVKTQVDHSQLNNRYWGEDASDPTPRFKLSTPKLPSEKEEESSSHEYSRDYHLV